MGFLACCLDVVRIKWRIFSKYLGTVGAQGILSPTLWTDLLEQERDDIWFNSFFLPLFPFSCPSLFTLWHHFIYTLVSFLWSIELPQELLKHLLETTSLLVLLGSKRQPWTLAFPYWEWLSALVNLDTSHVAADMASHLHLWRVSRVWTLCWPEGDHTWQWQKGLYFSSLYFKLFLFSVLINLSTFRWVHLLNWSGRRKCSVEMHQRAF